MESIWVGQRLSVILSKVPYLCEADVRAGQQPDFLNDAGSLDGSQMGEKAGGQIALGAEQRCPLIRVINVTHDPVQPINCRRVLGT